jgi:hypothetical protein
MRTVLVFVAGASFMVGGAAHAQASGAWRIDGSIAGRTFLLDCDFNGSSSVCVDAQSDGKRRSHPLTSFTTSGDQVAWSFKTKVGILRITLDFSGKLAGGRMNGTMRAAGRSGSFTGVRRP